MPMPLRLRERQSGLASLWLAACANRARLSRHPEASTTLSMHSPRPIVVTVRWLAVLVNGSCTMRRRRSAGSRLSCSAALSSWHSSAKRGCGVP
jgi:hypothetical protein